ncbi:hypothetical protein F4808DRAFT_217461 [Astrocystis sublimbata]|nr:hypothetical protein F4808DRAFT_217461 [Astrocystis sublimbata]
MDTEPAADQDANSSSSSDSDDPVLGVPDPVRILVETSTHLVPAPVPSDNEISSSSLARFLTESAARREESIARMRDIICQYHWSRDFDGETDRCYVYGFSADVRGRSESRSRSDEAQRDESGNRGDNVCFFMVDSGETVSERESPPVLRYRWTGKKLVYIRRALPAVVVKKLREYPFMRKG